jgi:hypothetical protein
MIALLWLVLATLASLCVSKTSSAAMQRGNRLTWHNDLVMAALVIRSYWRRKSHARGGRPAIAGDLRALIRQMSLDNPLWGAPRIHGELLKLGFEVAQSTVAKYMFIRWGPPSQGWRTFLRNHAPDIAAMDLFVVPTVGFSLLYVLVIERLDRRALVWTNVTQNPSAAPGTGLLVTCSETTIVSMATSLSAVSGPRASATSLSRWPHLGKMASLNG